MLARLQQFVTLSSLLASALWLAYWWERSAFAAAAGVMAILFGYAFFLAIEFVLMQRVNRADPAPRASWSEVLRAWWLETTTAPAVFCWRQPFFSQAVPDHLPDPASAGRRGVVLVHGFVCNRGFWTPWLQRLRSDGVPFAAVSLEPVFGDIDDYVPIVEAAVQKVTQATGLPPILICHSMGGLAARAWMRTRDGDTRVAHVITIGSPHNGTWMGRFGHAPSGRQMCEASDWLCMLRDAEPPARRSLFTCWYSNCDNIVFPASTAKLEGADNIFLPGAPHVGMAFHPRVIEHALGKIRAQ
jgi:hypothetical protein